MDKCRIVSICPKSQVWMMIRKIEMKNLTCTNCIAKVERRVARLPYVNSASFNYMKQTLLVDFHDDYNEEQIGRAHV